jgi:hypothetical protein
MRGEKEREKKEKKKKRYAGVSPNVRMRLCGGVR